MAEHIAPRNSFWSVITSPEARKAQVAIVGVLLALITAGLIPADIGIWVNTIVGALVAAGVFTIPNAVSTPEVAPSVASEPVPFAGDVKG